MWRFTILCALYEPHDEHIFYNLCTIQYNLCNCKGSQYFCVQYNVICAMHNILWIFTIFKCSVKYITICVNVVIHNILLCKCGDSQYFVHQHNFEYFVHFVHFCTISYILYIFDRKLPVLVILLFSEFCGQKETSGKFFMLKHKNLRKQVFHAKA